VRVLPVEAGAFNCLVRVMCGGRVIYPNADQSAGYAPCQVENGQPITATDNMATSSDSDPIVHVDMRAGTVEVADRGDGVDSFRATLEMNDQFHIGIGNYF
jgi:hypothetical protein